MTKRKQRQFKKQKQRQERIRQQRHRGKFATTHRRSFLAGYEPLPSAYLMTGILEAIMVLAILEHRAMRR